MEIDFILISKCAAPIHSAYCMHSFYSKFSILCDAHCIYPLYVSINVPEYFCCADVNTFFFQMMDDGREVSIFIFFEYSPFAFGCKLSMTWFQQFFFPCSSLFGDITVKLFVGKILLVAYFLFASLSIWYVWLNPESDATFSIFFLFNFVYVFFHWKCFQRAWKEELNGCDAECLYVGHCRMALNLSIHHDSEIWIVEIRREF